MTFTTGEKVRLKSGGPIMTINSFSESEDSEGKVIYNIRCHWFSEDSLAQGIFNYLELEKV